MECDLENNSHIQPGTSKTKKELKSKHERTADGSDRAKSDQHSSYNRETTFEGQIGEQADIAMNNYKDYDRHDATQVQLHQQFIQNTFGHACKVCNGLWFKNDFQDFQKIIENYQDGSRVAVCSTCDESIKKNKIPNPSIYDGFKYYDIPRYSPMLNIISGSSEPGHSICAKRMSRMKEELEIKYERTTDDSDSAKSDEHSSRRGKFNVKRQRQEDLNILEKKRQTQFQPVASNSDMIEHFPSSSKECRRKTKAERQKEYRERQKYKNIPEKKRKGKSNVERQKDYRGKQKINKSQTLSKPVAGASGIIENALESSRELKLKKNAQRQKRFRDKHNTKDYKLRQAAYSKAYRDKKKIEKFSNMESKIQKSHNFELKDENPDTIQNFSMSSQEPQSNKFQTKSSNQIGDQTDTVINKYKDYGRHVAARVQFHQQFTQNPFGHACKICDRLWFKNDLKLVGEGFQDLLQQIVEDYEGTTVAVCSTCHTSIKKNKIPCLSTYNGFKYHDIPKHLPKLDIISERLISPRLPFVQIKRLRHHGQTGQYKFYGQVVNIPIEVNNIVKNLPRHFDDECSIYVHIKKKVIHNIYDLKGLIKKQNIKVWLKFLVNTPLYQEYGITIDESFFDDVDKRSFDDINDVSEYISDEETLTAQQQTLLWDEDKFLGFAPGEDESPISLLFNEHAEELSFPAIYLGQFRNYKIPITPFMQANSELRRSDRRGATPNHILYLAMKIMRLRVKDSLTGAFKHTISTDNITKEQIMESDYINTCIESNLAFLKSMPSYCWSARKRDLFAMIRQLGRPTAFMTLSANELNWIPLLKILYKLKNSCDEIPSEVIEKLGPMERSELVIEDPVTCAIHFNKLVNVLMTILMSKRNSPFGKYHVIHFYKCIEFQNRSSPRAHILLWLNNAPHDVLDKNYDEAIEMINNLLSVSASEASGNIKLNTHKHTDTCYKEIANQQHKNCRFEAPFIPSRHTVILSPMDKEDENYPAYRKQYDIIRKNFESYSYIDIDDFYNQNNITSDQHYNDIIRAGINRPKAFIKRLPSEKWYNSFNPFIFNLLQSNMDFQLILDEYSCAKYVVEYVNKTDRGISDLQEKIIQIVDEHPEFDIEEITRKMGVEMLNTVEISSQEAAWYLLREPMSKSSTVIVYIPTVPPHERQQISNTMEELEKFDNESTESGKENLFDEYEKRPEYLNYVSLAQFVSKYYKQSNTGQYAQRKQPKIIRYRNYDKTENFNEYRREMATLHIPFKNEQEEILLDNKYINTYEDNKDIIMEKRKEFESEFDVEKTMSICRQMCRDNNEDLDSEPEVV